jgi:competence protein ComEC
MNLLAWRYRRFHPAYLIGWCCVGILLGLLISQLAGFAPGAIWLAAAILTALSLFHNRRWWAVILIAACGMIVGWERGAVLRIELAGYAPYYNQQATLEGKIAEDVVVSENGEQQIRLGGIVLNNQKLPGQVWVNTGSRLDLKRSDVITVEGKLGEGFGNFPATIFRANVTNAERPRPGDVARIVRDWFAEGVRQAIPEPEASLGVGYLVGQRSTLPPELDEQLRMLGLTHVVVASGYNLTILVRFARRAFAGISKYLATAAAGTMIAAFVLVTGFSPSMTRAALITGLSLLAWYYGRKLHPIVLLIVGAAITALINPLYIWGDLGWFLSFAAFAGVILLAPLFRHLLWPGVKNPGTIKQILSETTAAQLLTMPIIAFAFGQYSVLALPANVLILPLVPFAMLLTFFAGLAGVMFMPIAKVFGFPADAVLSYMTTAVDKLASLPWAEGELAFGPIELVASYALLLALGIFLWRKTKHDFRNDNIVE